MKKKAAKQTSDSKPSTKSVIAIAPEKTPREKAIELVEKAIQTGKCLIGVCRVENGQCFHDRIAIDFPKADIGLAIKLISEDLESLK